MTKDIADAKSDLTIQTEVRGHHKERARDMKRANEIFAILAAKDSDAYKEVHAEAVEFKEKHDVAIREKKKWRGLTEKEAKAAETAEARFEANRKLQVALLVEREAESKKLQVTHHCFDRIS